MLGVGKLHPATARCRPPGLQQMYSACSEGAGSPAGDGDHRQQSRKPHHQRSAQNLRRRLRVHAQHDQ